MSAVGSHIIIIMVKWRPFREENFLVLDSHSFFQAPTRVTTLQKRKCSRGGIQWCCPFPQLAPA